MVQWQHMNGVLWYWSLYVVNYHHRCAFLLKLTQCCVCVCVCFPKRCECQHITCCKTCSASEWRCLCAVSLGKGDAAESIWFFILVKNALEQCSELEVSSVWVCVCGCGWRGRRGVLELLCVEEARSEAFSKFIKRLIERRNLSFPCQRRAAPCSSPVTPLLNQLLWGQPIHFSANLKQLPSSE